MIRRRNPRKRREPRGDDYLAGVYAVDLPEGTSLYILYEGPGYYGLTKSGGQIYVARMGATYRELKEAVRRAREREYQKLGYATRLLGDYFSLVRRLETLGFNVGDKIASLVRERRW